MRPQIIVLDDEQNICVFLSLSLEDMYEVYSANTPAQAFKILERQKISLVLVDLMLGKYNGLDFLRSVKERYPEVAVIMMTAFGNIASSVEAIKLGAYNYLTKPLNIDELKLFIKQAIEFQQLNQKVDQLREELETRNSYGNMVGQSPQMQAVYRLIDKLKDVDTNVMITGESGTGKELVARAIHYSGLRRQRPFVTVNCAAIPSGLLESEFFGYKKGSFTGAVSDSAGKLKMADGGTFFFDEIGELPLELQGKILRVIQEKEVSPIGEETYQKIDVRFIAATNRDLWEMVQQGRFRQDLYYRLQVVEIKMPPLRKRKEDILPLTEQFLKKIANEKGKAIKGLTKRAEEKLINYTYPGNVRELINAIEYALVLCENDIIDEEDLPSNIRSGPSMDGLDLEGIIKTYLTGQSIKDVEKLMIKSALAENKLSKRQIADMLGISERTLFYKIQEYGLT